MNPEASKKPPEKAEKHESTELNASHIGLYQQLYVPQFNAPNPSMIELEKLYKKYPKMSKPLFILNLFLIFALLFNISHKFNSLSWNSEHSCSSNQVFLGLGALSSLVWFVNCFLLAYSLVKRAEFGFKIVYLILGIQLAITSLAGIMRVFAAIGAQNNEVCALTNGEIVLFSLNAAIEVVLILLFMMSSLEMRTVLSSIESLRNKILTPTVYELNE